MAHPIHDPRYQRLAALLADARRQNGLLQQEVADRLGRPQAYVSKVESGARRLDVVELLDFLKALGVDPRLFIDAFLDQPPSSLPR